MPLTKSKSDKAFKHNIKAEIAAGKPQKQAVAIAYAVKRGAKKAIGGRMSTNPMDYDSDVDYYEARNKSLLSMPKEARKAMPSILKSIRDDQAAYAAKEGERRERQLAGAAATKASSDAYYAKQKALIAERMKKEAQPKAKGGKIKKTNSCW